MQAGGLRGEGGGMTYDPEWYKHCSANQIARLKALEDAAKRLQLELERKKILLRLKEIEHENGTTSFAE